MNISKIDYTIEKCRLHIVANNLNGTEIEYYLTRYLNVVIYSAFEEEIKKIVINFIGSKFNDPLITSYVTSSLNKIVRSILTSEIAGMLNQFSPNCKSTFNSLVEEEAQTVFNNIITNRHKIAHEESSNLTFQELVNYYTKGNVVLDAIVESLNRG